MMPRAKDLKISSFITVNIVLMTFPSRQHFWQALSQTFKVQMAMGVNQFRHDVIREERCSGARIVKPDGAGKERFEKQAQIERVHAQSTGIEQGSRIRRQSNIIYPRRQPLEHGL